MNNDSIALDINTLPIKNLPFDIPKHNLIPLSWLLIKTRDNLLIIMQMIVKYRISSITYEGVKQTATLITNKDYFIQKENSLFKYLFHYKDYFSLPKTPNELLLNLIYEILFSRIQNNIIEECNDFYFCLQCYLSYCVFLWLKDDEDDLNCELIKQAKIHLRMNIRIFDSVIPGLVVYMDLIDKITQMDVKVIIEDLVFDTIRYITFLICNVHPIILGNSIKLFCQLGYEYDFDLYEKYLNVNYDSKFCFWKLGKVLSLLKILKKAALLCGDCTKEYERLILKEIEKMDDNEKEKELFADIVKFEHSLCCLHNK